MDRPARVVVVANKWWECDPFLNVLLHAKARPGGWRGWPRVLHHPRPRPDPDHLPAENPRPVPRAVFAFPGVAVEIWCISDLLEHLPDQAIYQSSAEQKARQLPRVFAGAAPALVIAVGTAAHLSAASENGNVAVGTGIFMHNAHPQGANPHSNWTAGPFDTLIPSALSADAFARLCAGLDDAGTALGAATLARFLVPPLTPAPQARVLADARLVALGTVNVTDNAEFAPADAATLQAFRARYPQEMAGSEETTHGVIRVQTAAPFLFLSGLTDRVGQFATEVGPREYAQNTTAAHNAGVCAAALLPNIAQIL